MNLLDLKKNILLSFVNGEKVAYTPLTQSEIDEQVQINLAKIPTMIATELERSKTKSKEAVSIFFSYVSMYVWNDPKLTNTGRPITDEVFNNDLLPALIDAIRAYGITVNYDKDKGSEWATITLDELKKFCEYDKLKSLA